MGPLSGLRVIEVAQTVGGAFVGRLLANLGADVIKVEPPGAGDPSRHIGPFAGDLPGTERSGAYFYFNTSKRSVTADLESETGLGVVRRLAEQADAVIADAMPDDIDRWGLRYDALSAANPKVVVLLLTPFGMSGPYRNYKARNINVTAASGFSYILPSWAEETDPPLNPGGNLGEIQAGIHSSVGVAAALVHAQATGEGQEVEVSKQEACMLITETSIETLTYTGVVRARWMQPMSIGLSRPLPCKDGQVHPLISADDQWERWLDLMGNPEWGGWDVFATRELRGEHIDLLENLVKEWTQQYTRAEVVEMCQARSIPMMAVNDMRELRASRQLEARNHFVPLDHGDGLTVEHVRDPYRFSDTPAELSRPPRLGEHNHDVYVGLLGHSPQEVAKMAEAGVI